MCCLYSDFILSSSIHKQRILVKLYGVIELGKTINLRNEHNYMYNVPIEWVMNHGLEENTIVFN